MHQTIRHYPIVTYAISLALMTVFVALLQPIPLASAQQLTRPISQEISGTGTQGRRIENMGTSLRHPTKSLEEKGAQTSTHKPHRLIRKPPNLPIASVDPSPSDSSPINSVLTPAQSLHSDTTTSQSKEPSSPNKSVAAAAPLATMSVTPLSAAATEPATASTAPTGAMPLAAASTGNVSRSGIGGAGGRSMRRLAAEMPGLTQLISPPSAPVHSGGPAIGMSPTSLSFTAQQGSGNPGPQILAISNTGSGTLHWSASSNAAWLSLSPAAGTGAGGMTASVAIGSLTVGSHGGIITLSASGASSVTVPVTFTVSATPAIRVSPASLSFTATQGGSNPAAQTLSISNTGGGTLTWSASDNAAWLTLSPSTGTGNGTVALNVATGTLTPATYSGTVTLSGSTGVTPVSVPVSFTVSATPAIRVSPASLSFTAQQGSSNPATQTLTISNTGGGTLNWSVSHDATWLSHTPGTGTGTGTVTISVLTGFLTAGTYNGVVTLYATGAPSVTVPMAFTVTPSATTASTTINLNPSSLSYAATQGAANPVNQNVSLTTTGGTVNWTISDDASWLAVNLTSGSGSSTLTASVNTAGVPVGTHNGTITVSSAGISPRTVTVTLTVNAPATSSATLAWDANTENDLAGYKIYRATTSGGYGAPIATLQGNVTTFIASGLQTGTTYFFVITAYDLSGNESPYSNEISRSIF